MLLYCVAKIQDFFKRHFLFQVPDYYEIVANPIDLETMREKVNGCQYSEYQEFIEDIDQLFTNARLYNKVCL